MVGGTAMLRGQQAQALAEQGRYEEALALIEGASADEQAALLALRLNLAKALERYDIVVAIRRAQVAQAPTSMVAFHNLASALGDFGLVGEAETAARKAFTLGGDAPETWLVLARALQGQGRWEEAKAAFTEVLKRRSDYAVAASELAQLIWMCGGTQADARATLLQVLSKHPATADVLDAWAVLDSYMGLPESEVYAQHILRMKSVGTESMSLEVTAANLSMEFNPAQAVQHAGKAVDLAPNEPSAWAIYAQTLMVAGRIEEAAEILSGLVRIPKHDQMALALHATAMRALGKQDALGLDDADGLIRAEQIDTPDGWENLTDFLVDLKSSLERQHGLVRHPVGQSLRHGTQTSVDLCRVDDPVIKAFFSAIDTPIRRYLAALGQGDDPVRKRNTGDYRFAGCWSVRLGNGGFHKSHIHSKGWLSSACYIDLPDAIGRGGNEGWIGFGVPPFNLPRPLDYLKLEKPEPGKLVLFPSCMWHGTLPFTDECPRLTIAFDLLPA